MVFKGVPWTGVVICFVLYCLVFVAVRFEMDIESEMQSGPRFSLLIFAVPGAIAALSSRDAPLTIALTGALLATPVMLLIMHFSLAAHRYFFQELAFATSAAFWCGSGALLVMLSRSLVGHEEQSD